MDGDALQSVLDELRDSFSCERFRDSTEPVHSYDSFWVDTFHRCYLEGSNKERDDLLFYVKLNAKQTCETVEVLRRDSKSLPKRSDRNVLWEQTLYLNIILHEFSYHVSSATLTVKPKSDQVDEIITSVQQRVYPSPTERRMDSKGKMAEVSYPNVVFSIDNFEDIFSDIYTSRDGQKVAVQLMASNERTSLDKMVFLGAIDHTTLKASVDEKEQVSLSSKLKKQLTLKSKSGKIYNAQRSYHFVKMRGPQLKGFAEMAVIRRDSSYLDQPGIFTSNVDAPSNSENQTDDSLQTSQPITDDHDQVFTIGDKQELPPTETLGVASGGGTIPGGTILGGNYSPKLRQAFLGQSSTGQLSTPCEAESGQAGLARLPSTASSISRSSCSSQTGLLPSKDRQTNSSNGLDESDEVFDHVTKSQRRDEGVASDQPTRLKYKDSMKDLLQPFIKRSKKKKPESDGELMFAYLTYIQLPWYIIMEDILNGTRPKVL